MHGRQQNQRFVARDKAADRILELTSPRDEFVEWHRAEGLALLETGDIWRRRMDHGHQSGVAGLDLQSPVFAPSGQQETIDLEQGVIIESTRLELDLARWELNWGSEWLVYCPTHLRIGRVAQPRSSRDGASTQGVPRLAL